MISTNIFEATLIQRATELAGPMPKCSSHKHYDANFPERMVFQFTHVDEKYLHVDPDCETVQWFLKREVIAARIANQIIREAIGAKGAQDYIMAGLDL